VPLSGGEAVPAALPLPLPEAVRLSRGEGVPEELSLLRELVAEKDTELVKVQAELAKAEPYAEWLHQAQYKLEDITDIVPEPTNGVKFRNRTFTLLAAYVF
jgi:hypothetical protein